MVDLAARTRRTPTDRGTAREILRRRPTLGLLVLLALLVCAAVLSLALGAAHIPYGTVFDSIFHYHASTNELIVRTVRVPRTITAIAVGASLALAGAIMQVVTRNPLASPSILGVNAGAALAVVGAIFLLHTASATTATWIAFAGAAVAAGAVMMMGQLGGHGLAPLRLVIAGAALSALLSSITTGVLVVNQQTLDQVRLWLAGSISERATPAVVDQVLPYIAAGCVLTFLMARQITILGLGDDIARGLGQNTSLVRMVCLVIVVLLAGSAVAMAGPVGFIGLAVPHIARLTVGPNRIWTLAYTAVIGGLLLVVADIVARLVIAPEEIPVGVLTAILGSGLFIHLARNRVRAS